MTPKAKVYDNMMDAFEEALVQTSATHTHLIKELEEIKARITKLEQTANGDVGDSIPDLPNTDIIKSDDPELTEKSSRVKGAVSRIRVWVDGRTWVGFRNAEDFVGDVEIVLKALEKK